MECFINRAFRESGHDTICLDYRRHRHRLNRVFLKPPECDAFFLQRGDHFPAHLVKAVERPRFFWNSELVSRREDCHHLIRTGLFNHVFLRSKDCRDTAIAKGWVDPAACSILEGGFDGQLHRRKPEIKKDIDLLFVGNITPRRAELLEFLKRDFSVVATTSHGEGQTLLFNRAKIVLNIHAADFLDTETRVFEALGCGSFLLSETLSSNNPFGEDMLSQWRNLEELRAKASYYLAHEEERENIAGAGHAEALAKHSYLAVARRLVEVFSRYLPQGGQGFPVVESTMEIRAKALCEPVLGLANWPVKIGRKAWRKVVRLAKGGR